MKIGDHVEFALTDCCLGVDGAGVITGIETEAEQYARDYPSQTPDEPDRVVAVAVNGIWVRHPWGEWTDEDFTPPASTESLDRPR